MGLAKRVQEQRWEQLSYYNPNLPVQKQIAEQEWFWEATYFLIACLDFVKESEKAATPTALKSGAGAAAAACGIRARPLSIRVNRAAKTLSYRTRRASRRKPGRRLRVSCRRAKDGKLTVRIRTRSRRTKLRKVLGPRLVVGLHRTAGASGTTNVQTTFKR